MRAGRGPAPVASGPARSSRLILACPFGRSCRMGLGRQWVQVRVLIARAVLRSEGGGGDTRGTDSDGAPTDPGAMGTDDADGAPTDTGATGY